MMDNIIQWWDGLSGLLKGLYCIALPSTLLLIIQTLLAMIGMHNGGMGHDFSDTSGLDMHTGGIGHDIGGVSHDICIHHDIGLHHDMGVHHDIGTHHDMSANHDANMHHSVDGGDPGDFATMHVFTLQTIITFLTVFSWSSIVLVGTNVPKAISLTVGIVLGLVTMILVAKMVQLSSKLAENGTVDLRNAIGEVATVYIPCPPKNEGMGKVTLTVQGQMMELGAFNTGTEVLRTGTQVIVTDVSGDDVVVEKEG